MSIQGIGRLAVRAIAWLTKAVRFYRRHRAETRAVIDMVRSLGIPSAQLEKFFAGLVKLEGTAGAHTHAWPEIQAAAKAKRAPKLTAADARYLYGFKRLFDRRIKKLFQAPKGKK